MKYYIIAGEASGDLHASHLIAELKRLDPQAEFRGIGGDMMQQQGASLMNHYRNMAYMGFLPVITHLRTILGNMERCKKDIEAFSPHVVILVDYPGFNLKIARHVKEHLDIPVHYYISPKIWAWKEYRIKSIKKYIDRMYSILPFETEFYAGHNYSIDYVGNPTMEEVTAFRQQYSETPQEFRQRHGLDSRKIIALLAGSRRQEISANLPDMLEAASRFSTHQIVVAGAPGIEPDFYTPLTKRYGCKIVFGETYRLLANADVAAVTSGTATLETALLGVPQVVCYKMKAGRIAALLKKLVIKVKYVSLVNLIAGREVVPELIAHMPTSDNISRCLSLLSGDTPERKAMLQGYDEVRQRLGSNRAAQRTAELIVQSLKG